MNSREMLISNARKAMLDNITALDKKTLQQELESHLKLEFAYKDELDDYKSRCEKAIQREMELSYLCDTLPDEELLNILQGEDKDVKY